MCIKCVLNSLSSKSLIRPIYTYPKFKFCTNY